MAEHFSYRFLRFVTRMKVPYQMALPYKKDLDAITFEGLLMWQKERSNYHLPNNEVFG
jgi:hypothetical protein